MKKSTATSELQTDLSYFQGIEGMVNGKEDILIALLKGKIFEKAHEEKRYIPLFRNQK